MSLFSELKRRNVIRVGLAYTVFAWLVAQVLQLVFESFGAPGWVMKSMLVLLLIGLPVAMTLAWLYELTPEGLRRETSTDRAPSTAPQIGRKLDHLIIVMLLLAVIYFAVDKFALDPTGEEARPGQATQAAAVSTLPETPRAVSEAAVEQPAIAVLPFVNMSEDKDYFADGLSEELLNMLANVSGLKVAGRTSSFMFKGRNEDLRDIGQALGVTTILEGSVRRSGERLRITAQLVNVNDGFHVWSETYDRQLADIFDIQDDVAQAITEALKVHLLVPEQRPTDSVEAYALYLEAKAIMQGRDWSRALDVIDAAIALDPDFARAWELKAAYYYGGGDNTTSFAELQRLCNEAANRALALDPNLPVAHVYAVISDTEYSPLQEYDALLELVRVQPNNLLGIFSLGWYMRFCGYFEQSLNLAERKLALDPLSATAWTDVGVALTALGRRDEAYEAWQQGIDRGDSLAASLRGWSELLEGNDESAIAWFEKAWVLSGAEPWDVRSFIESARRPATGKAFLDQKMAEQSGLPAPIASGGLGGLWYLALGRPHDHWRWLERIGINADGWSDAIIPFNGGMLFNKSGFTALPEYQRWANERLAPVWEAHGAPDHCRKSGDQWVCE